MLVATALVLMMTVPALALFYGGMSRSKSVLNMMMMSYVAAAIVGILYVAVGWSMGWSGDGTFFANPFDLFWLDGVGTGDYVFVMFQMTFAIITVALISGAVADRMKFSAWVVFVPVWALLCYFPMAHMVFSCTEDSLICGRIGAQDYAGGTAVHINAGVAGLVLAVLIGKRLGFGKEPMRPHNLTLTMLGAGLLWFGWYGFNVGSIVIVDQDITAEMGRTFANTTLATMGAIIGWLVVEKVLHKKATSLGAASGIVAGLVAITPAAGAVDLSGATAIGLIAGAVCAWAVGLKFKLGYDDSLDVVGVHLVGGIIGTVLIGIFSTSEGAGGVDGLLYGGGLGSLGDQTLGALVAIVFSGVVTTVIALAIKFTIGLRLDEDGEVAGIDVAAHGESAYDIHTGGGGAGSSSVLAPKTAPLSQSEGARA
ncbi:ammonium transporter [Nocardioides sp. YIM 123512]|uniref:Ammonium transporter n=2 Tax=Nocardioides flavescens TaxID=2691959 RepID=A0A6L7F048_9ACTN|nr:ammonium transporter [Nocardioides flavescens]MXG88064.1 ammonium transporter [Nocardioides flavescens]